MFCDSSIRLGRNFSSVVRKSAWKTVFGGIALILRACLSVDALAQPVDSAQQISTQLTCPPQKPITLEFSSLQITPQGVVSGLPLRIKHHSGEAITLDNTDHPIGPDVPVTTTLAIRIVADEGTLDFGNGYIVSLDRISSNAIGYQFGLGLRDSNGVALDSPEFEANIRYTTHGGRCDYRHTIIKRNLNP